MKIHRLLPALTLLLVSGLAVQGADSVDELIQDVVARQATVQSLRQASSWTIELEKDGQKEKVEDVSSALVFARPNQLKLVSEHLTLASNGDRLTFVFPGFESYIEREIEDSLENTIDRFDENMGTAIMPDIRALISADPVAFLKNFAETSPVSILEDGESQGRAAWHIRLDSDPTDMGGMTNIQAWIDKETGLLLDMTAQIDLAAMLQGRPPPPDAPERVDIHYTATIEMLNEEVEPALFTLDLVEYEEVADFEALRERAMEMRAGPTAGDWIGREAPDFDLTLLDGETFKLSAHRGKIVVIDFWATWCPPCLESLPYVVKIHDAVSEEDVVFVGVSLDRIGQESRVKQMMDRFNMTYPIGIDGKGKIAQLYDASSIPTMVVVDRDGKIIDRTVGFSPAAMEQLEKTLTDL